MRAKKAAHNTQDSHVATNKSYSRPGTHIIQPQSVGLMTVRAVCLWIGAVSVVTQNCPLSYMYVYIYVMIKFVIITTFMHLFD